MEKKTLLFECEIDRDEIARRIELWNRLTYQEVDGMYVCDTDKGFLTSDIMREIADYIDEKNEPLQKEIEAYFVNEATVDSSLEEKELF